MQFNLWSMLSSSGVQLMNCKATYFHSFSYGGRISLKCRSTFATHVHDLVSFFLDTSTEIFRCFPVGPKLSKAKILCSPGTPTLGTYSIMLGAASLHARVGTNPPITKPDFTITIHTWWRRSSGNVAWVISKWRLEKCSWNFPCKSLESGRTGRLYSYPLCTHRQYMLEYFFVLIPHHPVQEVIP